MRLRVASAYALAVVAPAALAGAAAWSLLEGGGPRCGEVVGATAEAAQANAEIFLRDVLVRGRPSCGRTLSTARMGRQLDRVPLFPTRYPLVTYRNARSDSTRTQAVYVLARPPGGDIRLGADDVLQVTYSVGLAAPDLGQAGYRVLLRLERGRWRVSRVVRVAV